MEAGLRTNDLGHPWPEEMHRRTVALCSRLHCAPTAAAAEALLAEGVSSDQVYLTGNTGIDALEWIRGRLASEPALASFFESLVTQTQGRRIVLATLHRRENLEFGARFVGQALARLADREDILIVLPLHPNPALLEPMTSPVRALANVVVTKPLDYPNFVHLLDNASLVRTDSGRIQEEAPSFGVPVLILRERSERMEAVAAATAALVGVNPLKIVREAERLLDDHCHNARHSLVHHPFGDGRAVSRICELLAR